MRFCSIHGDAPADTVMPPLRPSQIQFDVTVGAVPVPSILDCEARVSPDFVLRQGGACGPADSDAAVVAIADLVADDGRHRALTVNLDAGARIGPDAVALPPRSHHHRPATPLPVRHKSGWSGPPHTSRSRRPRLRRDRSPPQIRARATHVHQQARRCRSAASHRSGCREARHRFRHRERRWPGSRPLQHCLTQAPARRLDRRTARSQRHPGCGCVGSAALSAGWNDNGRARRGDEVAVLDHRPCAAARL